MKKILTILGILILNFMIIQGVLASDKVVVLTKGEPFEYPIANNAKIECYAKMIDGSIDGFVEYNDYFYMKDGVLYSDTMNKIYKSEKTNLLNKIDRVKLKSDKKTLQMYDPLWTKSIRRHFRIIKIDISTGNYFMKAVQDNQTWYRNAIATGYCHVINP